MRNRISVGIGAATAAIVLTTGAGAALAASGGLHQAAGTAVAAAAHKQISKARAGQIAKAKVPHSRVVEIESDDRHDRPVWKVTLATGHGRVIVDVDKRTGKATIVRRDGSGGHDDSARDAREDRRHDRRDHDRRGHDRHFHDRHDHHRGDR